VRFGDIVLESTEAETPGPPSTDIAVICVAAEPRAVRWAVGLGNASDEASKGITPNLSVHDDVVHLLVDTTGPLVLPGGSVLEPVGAPSTTVDRIAE